jgi:hypothetical protein
MALMCVIGYGREVLIDMFAPWGAGEYCSGGIDRFGLLFDGWT